MTFERHFIISSYTLFAVSFGMLVATRQLDPVAIILFTIVLAVGWMIDRGKLKRLISSWMANWLLLAFLPLALAEWLLLDLSPVLVVVHFILFASSLKLLREKSDRDWLWLYIVSFCLVLMTAGMMIGTTFLLLLVVYLFAAISTFISYEIRRSQKSFVEGRSAEGDGSTGSLEFWREDRSGLLRMDAPRSRSLTFFAATAMILIILLAVPLFLAMPRLTRGGSRNGLLATETLTGFSDTVRLGEVAQVKLNPEVVMRVRVKFSPSAERRPLRWRGVTLDHYDGRAWSLYGSEMVPLRKIDESFAVESRPMPRGLTQQRFFLEPLNISTVFAAPRPIFVMGLPELERDQGDGLWTSPHNYHKLDYLVYSDTSVPGDEELALDNKRVFNAEFRQRYLQLPSGHDRRIDAIAADVTRGAVSQIEIARRIEQFLRTGFSYTLDLKRVESGDPVADFLINTRAGHCEYFASAMVLMLRTRQVPARLVNGFQTGEYNDSADVFTVRQSDAHSWVEVFFPKYGWVAFDPTPPDGLSIYDQGILAWVRHYREALEMMWIENVVGYDTSKQLSMALNLQRWLAAYQRDASGRWLEWFSDLVQSIDSWREPEGRLDRSPDEASERSSIKSFLLNPLVLFTAAILLSMIAILLWRRYGRTWSWKSTDDASRSAVAFYQEMIKTLDRIGYKRAPHQTPAEFAARIPAPGVNELTILYQKTRFGGQHLNQREIARISAILEELKKFQKS